MSITVLDFKNFNQSSFIIQVSRAVTLTVYRTSEKFVSALWTNLHNSQHLHIASIFCSLNLHQIRNIDRSFAERENIEKCLKRLARVNHEIIFQRENPTFVWSSCKTWPACIAGYEA